MTKPDINAAIERTDDHHIERHKHFLNIKRINPIDLLFIGDSITRRWAEAPELWDFYFAKYHPANFGVGSDTIQNVKWRLLNGEIDGIQPKVVVLLIGANNLPNYSAAEIYEGISGLVDIIQQKLPESKIILMGLLPRDSDDQCDNYLNVITEVNHELLSLSRSRNLIFLDIGAEYLDANNRVKRELLPDGLHLIEPGYRIWGDKLQPIIAQGGKKL